MTNRAPRPEAFARPSASRESNTAASLSHALSEQLARAESPSEHLRNGLQILRLFIAEVTETLERHSHAKLWSVYHDADAGGDSIGEAELRLVAVERHMQHALEKLERDRSERVDQLTHQADGAR